MIGKISNERVNDRLGAAMDEARRIAADTAADRAAKLKEKTISINFTAPELDRLRARADAACMRLQDYIRHILSTYA